MIKAPAEMAAALRSNGRDRVQTQHTAAPVEIDAMACSAHAIASDAPTERRSPYVDCNATNGKICAVNSTLAVAVSDPRNRAQVSVPKARYEAAAKQAAVAVALAITRQFPVIRSTTGNKTPICGL